MRVLSSIWVVCNKSYLSWTAVQRLRQVCLSHSVVSWYSAREKGWNLALLALLRCALVVLDPAFHFCCGVGHKKTKHSVKSIPILNRQMIMQYYEKVALFGRVSRLLWSVRCKWKINGYRLLPEGTHVSQLYRLGAWHGRASVLLNTDWQ